jgi:hypothetical protein
MKGEGGGKEVWDVSSRIGNWNPEKANFPSLDVFAFTSPGTVLHLALTVVITVHVVRG